MNENKLKPCPFCGGEAVFVVKTNSSSHHGVGFSFEIECRNCGANLHKTYRVEFYMTMGGDISTLNDDRKRAAEEWNQRNQ